MTIRKVVLSFLFCAPLLHADVCERGFDIASEFFQIDKDILKGLTLTETDMNQYAILIKTSKQKEVSDFLKKRSIRHKYNEQYVNIYPTSKAKALDVYHNVLKNTKFEVTDYDLGLMQVNQYNLNSYKVDEEEYYLDCIKNIFLATDVLRKCFDRFQNTKDTIECYHRGTSHERIKKSNYTYFNKFFKHYSRISSVNTD